MKNQKSHLDPVLLFCSIGACFHVDAIFVDKEALAWPLVKGVPVLVCWAGGLKINKADNGSFIVLLVQHCFCTAIAIQRRSLPELVR